jgi:CubicO group peptidase (beta-lactamase class C family)
MSNVFTLTLAFLMFANSAVGAANPTSAQIDAIFAELQSSNAPGAAVLVLKDGHKVFERGYGVRDLQSQHKIDSATNFRLASLSKQFTATSIMLLVHDGKLRYEDRLTDVFSDFPAYGKAISIRQLLNHTSGLKDYEDLMDEKQYSDTHQIQDSEVLSLLKQQTTTKFPPGTHWEYSNSGYVLLGLMVARVSGKPFPDFLRDRIFAPLGMTHTLAYVNGRAEIGNRAYGHSNETAGWHQTDQSSTSATLGDGGIYTSLDDLAKWDDALRQHTLLSAEEMQPAFTPVNVSDNSVKGPDNEPAEYGFGWYVNPYKGHPRMWHYGETMGFRTNIQRFVQDNLTIIVLCNRADLNPGKLAEKVADLYIH